MEREYDLNVIHAGTTDMPRFALYTDENHVARYIPLPLRLTTKRRRYKVPNFLSLGY